MSEAPPLVVSYHTPAYAEEADGLRGSLEVLGIEHRIVAEAARGGWLANCARKAGFIREQLADPETRARGVLWLDADARVRRPLDELWRLAACCHAAAHWRDGVELLSGTLLLRGEPGYLVAQMWEAACACHLGEWDQRVLHGVLFHVPGLVVGVIPAPYCWIETFMPQIPRALVAIEHRQASRRLRDAEEEHPVDEVDAGLLQARDGAEA